MPDDEVITCSDAFAIHYFPYYLQYTETWSVEWYNR